MSNFACEKCGAIIIDGPTGYITGCEHYPVENKNPTPEYETLRTRCKKLNLPPNINISPSIGQENITVTELYKNLYLSCQNENTRLRKALQKILNAPQFRCKELGICESCMKEGDYICEYLVAKEVLEE